MSMFDSVFKDELIWHQFDSRMTDDEVHTAVGGQGVAMESIDRTKSVVWQKGQEFTPEIQELLNNWAPDTAIPNNQSRAIMPAMKTPALLQYADGNEVVIELDLADDTPPVHYDDELGRPFLWVGDNEVGQAVYKEVRDTVPTGISEDQTDKGMIGA